METRKRFHQELDALKNRILEMAARTEAALVGAVTILKTGDAALARRILDEDEAINAMECAIDEESLKLLALEQPVALDLRRIVGAMRIIVDLERLGDEACNIAEGVTLMASLGCREDPKLTRLAEDVLEMFRQAVKAYSDDNPDQAMAVCDLDAKANELTMVVIKEAVGALEGDNQEPRAVEQAIHDILAARSLERIGDQTTNIAEAIIFIVRGVNLKHHCQPF